MDTSILDDISCMPTEQLEDEIRLFAANIAAATCRWLLLVAELDRREAWKAWGSFSCAHWLSWHCGVSLVTGREQLRVATALRTLPQMTQAFARGELSYAKVRALTRVASARNEPDLIELAREATAAQLETIVRAFRRCATDELEQTNIRHERRGLDFRDDDDGSLTIRVRIPPDVAPIVESAIEAGVEALREGLPPPSPIAEPPTATQLRADAFVALCEAALTHELAARPGTDRTLVKVLVSAETITGDDPDGISQIEGSAALARATVRRLLCDCATIPVIEAVDGTPIAVGQTQRTASRRQRRALLARNDHCEFPRCDHRRYLDIHHVIHWIDGGPTLLTNLIPLCWYHHRLVHECGFTVERVDGELVFSRPDGRKIEGPRALRPTADLGEQYVTDGDVIRARSNSERFDLGLTIDALFGLGCADVVRGVSAETSSTGSAP